MEYAIETRESSTFLTISMDKEEELDEFDYGMVKNNTIYGVFPILYVEVDGNKKLKYNITSKISLERFMASEISRNTFLTILKNLQKSFQEQQEYMMQPEYLCLDFKHVFVNPVNCDIFMACIPITSYEKEKRLGDFFKALIFQATYKKSEDNRYVAELINFLSNETSFSLDDFGRLLDDLILKTDPMLRKRGVYVPQKERRDIENVSQAHMESIKHEKEPKKALEKKRGKQEKGLSMGFRIPELETSKNERIDEINKKSDVSRKGFLVFGKKDKEDNGEENIEEKCSEKENHRVRDTHGEVLKGYEINEEGKLISCDGQKGKNTYPYLIRVTNNEKISITAEVFRIGRGKIYSNYRVDGNPLVGRNHADIVKKGEDYYLVDNNSKNHTYVNEKQLTSEHPHILKHGDKIRLANEKFIFSRY